MSDKLGPIEIQFILDKQADEQAKKLKTSLDAIGPSSKKSAADIRGAIEEQKALIKTIEKDLSDLDKQLKKAAPGMAKSALAQEVSAAKKALEEEKAALSGLKGEIDQTTGSTARLLTQQRLLKEQLVLLEQEGKRGTVEYDAMQAKLGDLTNRMDDANRQARILADDYATLTGIITGASGLAGAFSAAAGFVGIFGAESEKLEKIQTRVQSLIGITIGLQQVLNVLNKDSAFRIVTVRQATKLWEGAVDVLNTKLRINIGLSKALVATGIGVVIVAITALIALYSKWKKGQEEVNRIQQEFKNINTDVAKEVATHKVEVESLLSVAKNYNNNLAARNKAIEKLSDLMPEYNGYIDKEGKLIDNSSTALKNYLDTLIKVETAKAQLKLLAEKEAQRMNMSVEDKAPGFMSRVTTAMGVQFLGGSNPKIAGKVLTNAYNKAQADLQAEKDNLTREIDAIKESLSELLSDVDIIGEVFGSPDSGKEAYDASKELQARLLDLQQRTNQLLLDQRKDSLQKTLDQIDAEHQAELDKVAEFQTKVIEKYNKEKKVNLSTNKEDIGASISAIDPELARQFNEELTRLDAAYNNSKVTATRNAAQEVTLIMQSITNAALEENEKEILAVREKYDRIRQEILKYQEALTAAQEEAIDAAQRREESVVNDNWFIRNSDAFLKLFGEIDQMSTRALEQALEAARRIVEEKAGSLDPSDLKVYVNAITDAEQVIRQRNPFKALIRSIKEYKAAASDATKESTFKDLFKDLATSLDTVGDVFDAAGDSLDQLGLLGDNGKKIFSEISGMISGAGTVAMGIATGNPLEIIKGAIQLVTNAIQFFDFKSKRITANIEKYEQQLDSLVNKYQELKFAVEDALGTDVFKAQADQINNLRQQIVKYYQLIAEEQKKKKRKQDPASLQEWQTNIVQLREDIEDVYSDIMEQITGTSVGALADSLADALISAFQQGTDAAIVFGDVANNVLQNAVKNALKMQLLEKPIQDAVASLQSMMGSFDAQGVFSYDGLTEEEADAFRSKIAAIGKTYAEALEGLSFIFDNNGGDQTLSGAIKGVSEQTASVIAGQMNAIRIGQATSTDLMQSSLKQLFIIAENTAFLRSIDRKIDNLNNDNLRAQGTI